VVIRGVTLTLSIQVLVVLKTQTFLINIIELTQAVEPVELEEPEDLVE
jgi:hypothetical protein